MRAITLALGLGAALAFSVGPTVACPGGDHAHEDHDARRAPQEVLGVRCAGLRTPAKGDPWAIPRDQEVHEVRLVHRPDHLAGHAIVGPGLEPRDPRRLAHMEQARRGGHGVQTEARPTLA